MQAWALVEGQTWVTVEEDFYHLELVMVARSEVHHSVQGTAEVQASARLVTIASGTAHAMIGVHQQVAGVHPYVQYPWVRRRQQIGGRR